MPGALPNVLSAGRGDVCWNNAGIIKRVGVRIRFTQTTGSGAIVHCETAKGSVHDIEIEHISLLFGAIDVNCGFDALKIMRAVMRENKSVALFHAIHPSPTFLEDPQFQICPPASTHESTEELLGL